LWTNTRLACAIGADLSIEAYRRTLYQSYQVHVARNSSEVISGITTKVNAVVFGALLPLLSLVSSTVMLVAVMLALITINPMVASVAAIVFGGSYALITWMSRRRLYRNSQSIAHKQTQVVKALQEGLGGIRDVLLDGTQPVYCDIYRQADYPLRRAQASNLFIGGSPRHVMEALGMVLITILAYSMNQQVGGIATALPVLGALALGAQRLLPALQQTNKYQKRRRVRRAQPQKTHAGYSTLVSSAMWAKGYAVKTSTMRDNCWMNGERNGCKPPPCKRCAGGKACTRPVS
jgi:ATP-binding cassette subfamily B protein